MQLIDVCELIVDCEHKTAPIQETGFPSIRTPNIGRGYFILDGVNRVSAETYEQWTRRAIPRAGDLIMAREAPVGNVALIPSGITPCLGQRTLLIRPDPSKVEPSFLNYFLNGPHVQGLIRAKTNGATVAHLNMQDVRTMQLPSLPPLPVQRRIANVLLTYDAFVESNQRRIRIVEEMARTLFREWFIKFRFPGHNRQSLAPPRVGEVPRGWVLRPMSVCVDINPRVQAPREGEKAFVPMRCLACDSMLITDVEARSGNSGPKFQNGDTLFARITPCLENGKTGFVQFLRSASDIALGSTEFIVLRSRTLTPEFVYLLARDEDLRAAAIKSMSGASGRQRVQERIFDSYMVACPPRALLDRFSKVVGPMFRMVHQLHLQSDNLRRTRDLLLPRLMSGQLSFSD